MSYDAIVVGLGGMGSAAAFHLAQRGARVLGLERFDIPHRMGSSHGLTRIIRLAYFEHPSYVPLLRRAYENWRAAERAYGEQLLFVTGGLDAGAPDSRIVRGALASCAAHDLPHKLLDRAALGARFPGYGLPSDFVGVFQPEGGFIASERAIVAHATLAQAHGADLRARERVLGWEPRGDGVRVTTDRGRHDAGRLILSAGAWMGDVVPGLRAIPERQVVGWFQPRDPAIFSPARFPVVNLAAGDGHWYALPVWGAPGLKVGRYHHRHEPIDPDADPRTPSAEDETLLRDGVRRFWPDADGPIMAMATCIFTNTPDEHFVIDTLPGLPQVVALSPCSGHGFKFAPVIGEIAADLVLRGETRFDLSLFRLDRPALRAA